VGIYIALLVGVYIVACETQYYLLYLLLLVYIFIVLSNGLQAALLVAVISTSWIIYEHTKGYTNFHENDPNAAMLLLQLFVACVFITIELLAAMIAEQKTAFKDLAILNSELEERVLQRTQALNEKNILLQESMETAERLGKKLVTLARQAGMAEVANNVLHNIGNALNSVNTTTSLLFERIIKSKVKGLPKASELLQTHLNDLGSFLTEDENGRFFPAYLANLSSHWEEDQKITLEELEKLKDRVEYINHIIAAQQPLSGNTIIEESVLLQTICEEAIIVSGVDTDSYHINLTREYTDLPDVFLDKLKLLQIMTNLLSNAKDSLKESSLGQRNIKIRIFPAGDNQIQIEVTDNGLGIASENMGKIFSQGFTTKELGHGIGLHSSAIAAQEMGGTLQVKSEGMNKGATFILTIPKKEDPSLKNKH
jgi:signal transduction histidine kinase